MGGGGDSGGDSSLPAPRNTFPGSFSTIPGGRLDHRQVGLLLLVSLLLDNVTVASSLRRSHLDGRLGGRWSLMSTGSSQHRGFQRLYDCHRLQVYLRIDAVLTNATRREMSFLSLHSVCNKTQSVNHPNNLQCTSFLCHCQRYSIVDVEIAGTGCCLSVPASTI